MDFGIARMLGPETAPQTSAGARHRDVPVARAGAGRTGRRAHRHLLARAPCSTSCSPGRPPFTGDSPVAIAYKQVNETPAPPSSLNPDVPPRLDAVVMKALAKNPSNRYQSAEEFSADLDRVIAGPGGRGDAADAARRRATRPRSSPRPRHTACCRPPRNPKGSGRKVWLGVLIGLLLFALLAGGGYLLVTSLTGDDDGRPAARRCSTITRTHASRREGASSRTSGLEVDAHDRRRPTTRRASGTRARAGSRRQARSVDRGAAP